MVVSSRAGEMRAVAVDTPEHAEDAALAMMNDWLDAGPWPARLERSMKILSRVEGGTVYREG